MNEPAFALLRHAMDNDVYLKYMDDPDEYHAGRKAQAAFYDRLRALLDDSSQKALDDFLNEKMLTDAAETEAAFTAGLSFGLQLLRLL